MPVQTLRKWLVSHLTEPAFGSHEQEEYGVPGSTAPEAAPVSDDVHYPVKQRYKSW